RRTSSCLLRDETISARRACTHIDAVVSRGARRGREPSVGCGVSARRECARADVERDACGLVTMNLEHLGAPVRPMTRVPGKASNRVYRLDTDQGSFAVKELDLDRGWEYRFDDVFRLETAAFKAGIPMPEPISATPMVLVH